MDKATVKLLLESYRPQDAHDPIFTEALREVAAHPELATWFEEMQRFDAVMAAKFQQVPVPPEVRSHILLGYHNAAPATDFRRPGAIVWISAIAAILVLGLIGWRFLAPSETPGNALALQAISFTEQMPALQFVCFDAGAVASWVNEQPGSQKMGLKLPKLDQAMSMAVIGSSVVDWSGRPVVMVCLQNGKRMAMLYILKDGAGASFPETSNATFQHADWAVRTTRADGQIRILTAKGGPEDLNFPMPF